MPTLRNIRLRKILWKMLKKNWYTNFSKIFNGAWPFPSNFIPNA